MSSFEDRAARRRATGDLDIPVEASAPLSSRR